MRPATGPVKGFAGGNRRHNAVRGLVLDTVGP